MTMQLKTAVIWLRGGFSRVHIAGRVISFIGGVKTVERDKVAQWNRKGIARVADGWLNNNCL